MTPFPPPNSCCPLNSCCPPNPVCPPPLDPSKPEAWDWGFNRLVPLIQQPTVSSGILAIAFFFLIAFSSNVLLAQTIPATLGITVTLSTFTFLALVVFILFLI